MTNPYAFVMDGRKIIVTAGQVPDRICNLIAYEMRTSSDVINGNFLQTVADILRNSELPGPLEALER